jgi:hypothetical protein
MQDVAVKPNPVIANDDDDGDDDDKENEGGADADAVEVGEINERLQRCLSTPSISSAGAKVCFENPEYMLSAVSMSLKELIDKKTHDICLCLREASCTCAKPDQCQCDSDEAVDVCTASFSPHSNCRYSIELTLKQSINSRNWPESKLLRLFSLSRDNSKSELPIVDVTSHKWSWIGQQQPQPKQPQPKQQPPKSKAKAKAKSKTKVETKTITVENKNAKGKDEEVVSYGNVKVYKTTNALGGGGGGGGSSSSSSAGGSLRFDLLDYVQVSERSILLNFDYMSFS